MKDILFLLPADLASDDGPWYCRECAEVRGVLAYYPRLLEVLDIREVAHPKPRAAIVELIGEAHQNAPTLVIGGEHELPAWVPMKKANGWRFVDNAKGIGQYLATAYGIGLPSS